MPPDYPVRLPNSTSLLSVTHPAPTIWQIELHNGADSRLTTTLLRDALYPALDLVEEEWRTARTDGDGNGALIIVGNLTQDKFFSNGLDFDMVKDEPYFLSAVFDPCLKRLFTFPIPTICAVNGHAFAAGFLISLACDYRVMTSGRAWCCMNETHFGAPLPPTFAAVLRAKLPTPALLRKCTLEGHRFTPQELMQAGIIDVLVDGGSKGVLVAAMGLAKQVESGAKTGVWGVIKKEIYQDAVDTMDESIDVPKAKL